MTIWFFHTTQDSVVHDKLTECRHSFLLWEMWINLIIKTSLMLGPLWAESLRWPEPIPTPLFHWHLTCSLQLSSCISPNPRQWVNYISSVSAKISENGCMTEPTSHLTHCKLKHWRKLEELRLCCPLSHLKSLSVFRFL